jgi:uncharacterized protein YjbI with pentapeptide repeats
MVGDGGSRSAARGAERLGGAAIADEVFEGLDLRGFDFSDKELVACTFRGAILADARWLGCRLEDCVFEDCDLRGFRPKGLALRGVELRRCDLGASQWVEVGSFPAVALADCTLRDAVLASLALKKTRFVRCDLRGAMFVDVDLEGARFEDCDLRKADFERCTLAKADLSTSRGAFVDPAKNRVRGARISVESAALVAATLGFVVTGATTSDD